MKQLLCLLLTALLGLGTVACSKEESTSPSPSEQTASQAPVEAAFYTPESQFTDRDLQGEYDPNAAVALALPQSGETLTLSQEGIYLLQGEGKGQILVDAPKTAKLQLVLDGVTLHHQTGAPIYIKQANKVFITLKPGTANTLTAGETFTQTDENTVDGVIFAKDDITINGNGSLSVTAPGCHGIVAKDDITLAMETLTLSTKGHGIDANNSLRMAKGTVSLNCEQDGMKVENEDAALGYIYIQKGNITGTTHWDGLSASGICQIDHATLSLTTGGGYTASSQNSCKGIKAGNSLFIKNGTFSVNSCDDALHANQNVTIENGTFTLSSGDDGIHADGNLVITKGTVTVSQSYEALEGQTISLLGGTHRLTAEDDGMNSAGGNDQSGFGGRGGDQFAVDENAFIHISGGHITVNAEGDGIDSNGTITVSGGETYLWGPVNGGNSALDGNGTKEITGGIFVALGTAEMAETFDTASQGVALVSLNGQAGVPLTLENQQGKSLISCTPEKTYQCAVISCPDMQKGESYTLSANGQTADFTLTELIYGEGMGMGNPGGHPGGGRPDGGRPGGEPPGGGQPFGGFGGR